MGLPLVSASYAAVVYEEILIVIQAEAGIQVSSSLLDPGFRQGDGMTRRDFH